MADPEQRERFLRLLHGIGIALLIGIPAAGIAYFYEEAVAEAQHLLFESAPHELGLDGLPGWWVVLVTTAGAVLCAAALRLPGKGGHGAARRPVALGWATPDPRSSCSPRSRRSPSAPCVWAGGALARARPVARDEGGEACARRRAHAGGSRGCGRRAGDGVRQPARQRRRAPRSCSQERPAAALLTPFLGAGRSGLRSSPASGRSRGCRPESDHRRVAHLRVAPVDRPRGRRPAALVARPVVLAARRLATGGSPPGRLGTTPVLIAAGLRRSA